MTRAGWARPIGPIGLGTALLGALLLRGDGEAPGPVPSSGPDGSPRPPDEGFALPLPPLPHPAVRAGSAPRADPGRQVATRAMALPRAPSPRARLLASASTLSVGTGAAVEQVANAADPLPQPGFDPLPEPPQPLVDPAPGAAPSVQIVAAAEKAGAPSLPEAEPFAAEPLTPAALPPQPLAILAEEPIAISADAPIALVDLPPAIAEDAPTRVATAEPVPTPGPSASVPAEPEAPPPAIVLAQGPVPDATAQRTAAASPAPSSPAATPVYPEPELAVVEAPQPAAKVASLAMSRTEHTARRSIPARRPEPSSAAPVAATAARATFPQPDFGPVVGADAPASAALAIAAPTALPRPGVSARPQPAQSAALAPAAGSPTFPQSGPPTFSYDDELILQIRVADVPGDDTLIAYGTRSGIYLPVGALARFLDLGIAVSDDGHYASGWFLSENRTVTIDLRQRRMTVLGVERALPADAAIAFDGEIYLAADRFGEFLPLTIATDLRDQSVTIRTAEPFPFEQRLKRDADRDRLASRQALAEPPRWPREETPWRALAVPLADVELRAMSDNAFGSRGEADLRLAGDLAFLSAQAFLSATTRDGLVSSNISLGRVDADGDLFGPLRATEFAIGDVSTASLPMGLRGTGGRGAIIGNVPVESRSVFDRIDLRGNLPDGHEVELYRNDVLIDSTREAINGEYRFEQVSLDYGLNVLRLVFYGPQGQRSEEVRRISVGDGRLAAGQFVYSAGVAQKDVNLLGVRAPRFIRRQDYGAWRAVGQISYGLSPALTATMGGAWYQSDLGNRWLGTAGLRSGIGGLAAKLDLGISDNGGKAADIGLGGQLFGVSLTVNHGEYRGGFIDEVRSLTGDVLRRVTEIDANATISIGSGLSGLSIPVAARARRIEFRDGRNQTSASLRASARVSGLLASNTLDYVETGGGGLRSRRQLLGSFDLATLSRSKLQVRGSVGYAVLPRPKLVSGTIEVDRALDDRTIVHGAISHAFDTKDTQFGLSAVRRFNRFTLALDGSYGLRQKAYSASLRLGLTLGRNPLDGRLFMATPGQAASGAIALRAFRDGDGDRRFGTGDEALGGVVFTSGNRIATSDANGIALLTGLGSGNRASVQADLKTLPDIALTPDRRGIEIVARPGRIHAIDYAVVETSDIEGAAMFGAKGGSERGVSGLRLQLIDAAGKTVKTARTESDGFYLFEQVRPGRYGVIIDPEQAQRLKIRLADPVQLEIGAKASTVSRALVVRSE